jgi:hypothetical protein
MICMSRSEESYEQIRQHSRQRRAELRQQCMRYVSLRTTGDPVPRCICGCGRIEDLEFSHNIPATKSFEIADAIGWNFPEYRTFGDIRDSGELDKVSLRNKVCHKKYDGQLHNGTDDGLPAHGTLARYQYRGCKCEACKAVNAEQSKEDRAAKKAAGIPPVKRASYMREYYARMKREDPEAYAAYRAADNKRNREKYARKKQNE